VTRASAQKRVENLIREYEAIPESIVPKAIDRTLTPALGESFTSSGQSRKVVARSNRRRVKSCSALSDTLESLRDD
jgi:hypothetical protein